jgi:hypothetical protein
VNKSWLPYLLVAMLMHALFNLFAIMGTLASSNQDLFSLLGLFLAFLLAASAFIYLRHKAKQLDRSIPCVPGSQ